MAGPIKRKGDTGEAGNRGQFGSLHREESQIDLSTIGDEELGTHLESIDFGDELDFDLDGDGKPDGELDIIRQGPTIRLEGTVTQFGKSRQVSEEIGEVSSVEELRAEIISAAQKIAKG